MQIENESGGKFVCQSGDTILAWIDYDSDDGRLLCIKHTEVAKGQEGKGLAKQLVEAMTDMVKSKNLYLRLECPYVQKYFDKHPEHQSVLKES